MRTLSYFVVRLWAPRGTNGKEDPLFVGDCVVDHPIEETQWEITHDFSRARMFKSAQPIKRLLRGVKEIAERVTQGWIYEIIRVTEEIVETNEITQEKESA